MGKYGFEGIFHLQEIFEINMPDVTVELVKCVQFLKGSPVPIVFLRRSRRRRKKQVLVSVYDVIIVFCFKNPHGGVMRSTIFDHHASAA